ncbi:unnamed protein product, partial [Laminaria digitata]
RSCAVKSVSRPSGFNEGWRRAAGGRKEGGQLFPVNSAPSVGVVRSIPTTSTHVGAAGSKTRKTSGDEGKPNRPRLVTMSTLLSDKTYVFNTRPVDGTLTIGISFIFLAYFLHPAIESAYQRVRAYRAWRAIEKRQFVDVTNYPMVAEVFGGRGKWDAARIITVLLGVFSLASWGLELSMDLAYYDGNADLLNRPPPVTIRRNSDDWQVMTRQELGESNWSDLSNVGEESAQSRYFMNSTDYEGFINGQISVAFWNTDPAVIPNQFYYLDGIPPMVEALECTGDGNSETVDVYLGDNSTDRWGTVLKCEQGPSLTQTLLDQHGDKTVSPPTIIMSSDKGEVFLIVEESSSYPSFLYSIWSVGSPDDTPTELEHKFHIAATMRLAEAVVTGIVHGEISGGACFGLLRKFSQSQKPYGSVADRASPFGEHPAGDSVEIQQLEKIEVGLEIGVNALVCFICIMLLTSIGIAWSFCLRSSIGMDVYDRDELIRAVSISGATAGDTSHSEMRIFVRKEDTGDMRVVVNDTGDAQSGCARILRKGGTVVEDTDPTPTVSNVAPGSDVVGGAVVPVGSRTVVLEGIRVRPSRRLPGPNGNFHYPTSYSLTASPVPSNANSPSGTPVWCPSPPKLAPRMGRGSKNGRGASVL